MSFNKKMLRTSLHVRIRRRLCTSVRIKESLHLPKTDFPQHHNAAVADAALAPVLARQHYQQQAHARSNAPDFVLHDGPPYANGDLHLGHFLNKTLKDIINRWMLLRGHRVQFTPGWDCHGLPIELRALQLAGVSALPPLQTRTKAAACAHDVIDAQRAAFERWGVMADWDRPYTTMQPRYEAAQLGVLQQMLRRGLIVRGERPVHWSPASRTALAEAELDYMDAHRSTAAFVAFPLLPEANDDGGHHESKLDDAAVAIWTTTPWTIPANQAICARADLEYVLVEVGSALDGAQQGVAQKQLPDRLVVAAARQEALSEALGRSLTGLRSFPGSSLAGRSCAHPLSSRPVPVLFGNHVSDDAGTGLVHTAPGHGPEDFAVGVAHDLSAACPVDEAGRFTASTEEAAPFAGLEVLDEGNRAVLEALRQRGNLLASSAYEHRYPYDWRSKTPIIFRTTPQWFVELDGLRESALAALEGVTMHPEHGRSRLQVRLSSSIGHYSDMPRGRRPNFHTINLIMKLWTYIYF